jgi:ribonuclease HI
MITTIKPHYLLFCEGNAGPGFGFPEDDASRWRFVLEHVESGHKIEAWDYEEILHPDRISLMAVIRGLEALDQPSKVTLITTNRYVARGLQYGLAEWRDNDFCWEHFGSIQPIRNQDLWRRVDVALKYHELTCRWMAYDAQQDRVDGDRRDVPVDTFATKEAIEQTKEENTSESSRAGSRSFSAMTRLTKKFADSSLPVHQSTDSGQTSGHCAVANAQLPSLEAIRPSNPIASDAIYPTLETAVDSQSKSGSLLRLPGTWIWRCVLRADTMIVYAVRSMLMLDPKPDSYRARR